MADTVYTREQILELPPGDELERIIEERLFGRRVERRAVEVGGAFTGRHELGSWHCDRFKGVPKYSRDDAAMGLVLDALKKSCKIVCVEWLKTEADNSHRCGLMFHESPDITALANSFAHAVARCAALFALGLHDPNPFADDDSAPAPQPDAVVEAPKRRGRPPKQRTEDASVEATQTTE